MKFAIVHNWPDQQNSELELIKRIVRISGDLGHKCSVIDPFGHPLSSDGEHLGSVEFLDLRQIFVLTCITLTPTFLIHSAKLISYFIPAFPAVFSILISEF